MRKALFYEFGEINVFKNFVIAIMKEGTTVKPEYNQDLIKVAETYFQDRPFGYITFRRNSYAVDPMIYMKTSEIKNLAAFAIVSTDGLKISNVELEMRFLKKPFKHFHNLDDAKNWVNEKVAESPSED